MFVPRCLQIKKIEGKGNSLFANRDFKVGEIVRPLKGVLKHAQDASLYAIQLEEDSFLDTEHRYVEDYINHSCDPTTKIDFDRMGFVCIRDIKNGEEITYNYLTTDYDLLRWNQDFICNCNSQNCIGRVNGFKFLDTEEQKKLKPLLSPFLLAKL